MKPKIFLILAITLGTVISTEAQNGSNAHSPALLSGTAKKQFMDSSLKNAGATPSQIQQFNNAKDLANDKAKLVKKDTTISIGERESRILQINAEKNASYKSILGAETYKTFNNLKNIDLAGQKVEINKPNPNKVTRDCLDSANATSGQKQQFMAVKRIYIDSMKTVRNNNGLNSADRKAQINQLKKNKNSKYLGILGQQKYHIYNLARKRRELSDNDD